MTTRVDLSKFQIRDSDSDSDDSTAPPAPQPVAANEPQPTPPAPPARAAVPEARRPKNDEVKSDTLRPQQRDAPSEPPQRQSSPPVVEASRVPPPLAAAQSQQDPPPPAAPTVTSPTVTSPVAPTVTSPVARPRLADILRERPPASPASPPPPSAAEPSAASRTEEEAPPPPPPQQEAHVPRSLEASQAPAVITPKPPQPASHASQSHSHSLGDSAVFPSPCFEDVRSAAERDNAWGTSSPAAHSGSYAPQSAEVLSDRTVSEADAAEANGPNDTKQFRSYARQPRTVTLPPSMRPQSARPTSPMRFVNKPAEVPEDRDERIAAARAEVHARWEAEVARQALVEADAQKRAEYHAQAFQPSMRFKSPVRSTLEERQELARTIAEESEAILAEIAQRPPPRQVVEESRRRERRAHSQHNDPMHFSYTAMTFDEQKEIVDEVLAASQRRQENRVAAAEFEPDAVPFMRSTSASRRFEAATIEQRKAIGNISYTQEEFEALQRKMSKTTTSARSTAHATDASRIALLCRPTSTAKLRATQRTDVEVAPSPPKKRLLPGAEPSVSDRLVKPTASSVLKKSESMRFREGLAAMHRESASDVAFDETMSVMTDGTCSTRRSEVRPQSSQPMTTRAPVVAVRVAPDPRMNDLTVARFDAIRQRLEQQQQQAEAERMKTVAAKQPRVIVTASQLAATMNPKAKFRF